MNRPAAILWLAALSAAHSSAAADFALAGAKATLSVEYRFEARGKQQDRIDSHEWNVTHDVSLVAQLAARRPQPTPTMQALDANQIARAQQRGAAAQKAHQQMAPMMADARAIVARCGDDEKCIEREVMKMGAGMSGAPQLDTTREAGKALEAASRPDADRFQRWEAISQTGRYAVDETWHVRHGDPMCVSLPGQRCNHGLTRKGAADWPAGKSAAAVEFDLQANTISLILAMPMAPLEVIETHTTDEPPGAHDWAVPKGPHKAVVAMRAAAEGKAVGAYLALPLKGGWRTQSGEQLVTTNAEAWHGAPGHGGKLVIRWRFAAH